MVVLRWLGAAAVLAAAGGASAHVSLQPAAAQAGAYQVLRFGVGHGCGDRGATTALRIAIPPGVSVARPQPKPGWTVQVGRSGDTVTAVTWRGGLPPDQFDEFLILAKLPEGAGPLAFPAVQSCGAEETRWTETATPGGPRPQHPAPALNLTPAAPEGGHVHHD